MQTNVLPVWWRDQRGDRIISAVVVVVVHALLTYAFLTALARHGADTRSEDLKLFDVAPPPPHTVEPAPLRKSAQKSRSAAPRNLRASPAPVPAPPLRIPLPKTIFAPLITGPDNQPSAGAAPLPGPGTGAGGSGSGLGSGTGDDGSGEDLLGQHAVRERGALKDSDYPRSAASAGAAGTVFVRFTVERDGRVSGCAVIRSSGNADLDATTCRLVERRFRYRPALDRAGRPIEETVDTNFTWGLRARL